MTHYSVQGSKNGNSHKWFGIVAKVIIIFNQTIIIIVVIPDDRPLVIKAAITW